jgi:hypothetical protein
MLVELRAAHEPEPQTGDVEQPLDRRGTQLV